MTSAILVEILDVGAAGGEPLALREGPLGLQLGEVVLHFDGGGHFVSPVVDLLAASPD
jgi:hypothetical protein